MDSRSVRKVLEAPRRFRIKQLDDAILWIVKQQRLMLADTKWDQDAYLKANEAIDYLLDARLEMMAPVGDPA